MCLEMLVKKLQQSVPATQKSKEESLLILEDQNMKEGVLSH